MFLLCQQDGLGLKPGLFLLIFIYIRNSLITENLFLYKDVDLIN
jgi:hypothetical protein